MWCRNFVVRLVYCREIGQEDWVDVSFVAVTGCYVAANQVVENRMRTESDLDGTRLEMYSMGCVDNFAALEDKLAAAVDFDEMLDLD